MEKFRQFNQVPVSAELRGLPKSEEVESMRTLEICPNCGEPVLGGSHTCNALGEYINEHLKEQLHHPLVKLYEESRARWGNKSLDSTPVELNIQSAIKKEDLSGFLSSIDGWDMTPAE